MSVLGKDRWRALEPYLDQALKMEPAERGTWLEGLKAHDPKLAADLQELLAENEEASRKRFLEGAPTRPELASSLAGQPVGAYTLIEPIGQGGMGSVWLARRSDGRFEGRVAVKLLNASLVGRAGEERFRREGSILARLSHPNIARLLDAGVSPSGQPYIVLEHVDGESDRPLLRCPTPLRRGAAAPLPRRLRGRGPGPCQPDRPSGHQALQRPCRSGRAGEAPRLRHREASGTGLAAKASPRR